MRRFEYFIDEIKDLVKNPNSMKSADADETCKKLANRIIGRDPLKNTSGIINKYTKKDIDEMNEYKKLRQKGEEILKNFCVFGKHNTESDQLKEVKTKVMIDKIMYRDAYDKSSWDPNAYGPKNKYTSECNYWSNLSKLPDTQFNQYEYSNKRDTLSFINKAKGIYSSFDNEYYWRDVKHTFCDIEPEMREYNKAKKKIYAELSKIPDDPEDVSLNGLRLKPRRKKKKAAAKKRRTKKR